MVVKTSPKRSKFLGMLQQRCPRCREGKLFASATRMFSSCPVCHLTWARESGYFVGAMYVSYALAIAFLVVALVVLTLLLPNWSPYVVGLLAILLFVPFVPVAFRYSRTIWIYFDRWAWPEDEK